MGYVMGQLVPQTIKTLFGGVSRQPVAVRRENQVETSDNAMPSIVSGGFEKRPCTQFISVLHTLENLITYSELLTNAAWVTSDMTVTEVTENALWATTHPYGAAMFQCEDTSALAYGSVTNAVNLTDVTIVTDEYIFSVDLKAGGTQDQVTLSITWEDASFASASFNLTTGVEVDNDGGEYISSDIEDLGDGWYRCYVWVSNSNGQAAPSCAITVGIAAVSTGSIIATRAQFEQVGYATQIEPSPYAYTVARQYIRQPTPGTGGEEYFTHSIDRDPTEQYMVLLAEGQIHIYDTLSGDAKQVIVGDSTKYFATDMVVTTAGTKQETRIYYDPQETEIEYALAWSGVTTGAPSEVVKIYHSVDGISWDEMYAETITTAAGTSTTTESLVVGGDMYIYVKVECTTAGATGKITVKGTYQDTGMLWEGSPAPEDFTACSVADHSFIANKLITVTMGGIGHPDGYTVKNGTYQTFADLPGAAAGYKNELAYVNGDDVDTFSGYWVVCKQDTGYFWTETVSPDIQNVFDETTMPFELVREPQGRFTLSAATWTGRATGDEDSNPNPAFVDNTISDIFFYRGRLGILTGESSWLSSSIDIYSWFAEKAVEVLDTDPIDRISGTEKITLLQYAVPFRKLLFITADTMQFELSSDGVLTPQSAALDPSTSYTASPFCKPALMGDTLYFAAVRPGGSTVFEYYFDDDTLSNTATDITKHIGDYIEGDILQMQADPVTGTLFVLASGDSASLFVYRAFWDDNAKVMSSWFKYTFNKGNAFIHGFALFSGYLVVICETSDGLLLLQSPIEREPPHAGMAYTPLLDQRVELIGTYSAGQDKTTWYTPYDPNINTIVVLGGDFASHGETPGRVLEVTEVAGTLVASGDYSDATCYIGNLYTMDVVLSRIYLRDNDGSTVLDGNLKLRDIQFSHEDTGYYQVDVTPFARDTYTYEYTGYNVSGGEVLLDEAPVQDGIFKVPVKTDAHSVTIGISNDTQFPCTITSATWRGFFSEISRM